MRGTARVGRKARRGIGAVAAVVLSTGWLAAMHGTPASAAVVMEAHTDIPNATVGNVVAADVSLQNLSTPPENVGTVTVNSIVVAPSCGNTSANCATGADPGVYQLPATATGQAGTACRARPSRSPRPTPTAKSRSRRRVASCSGFPTEDSTVASSISRHRPKVPTIDALRRPGIQTIQKTSVNVCTRPPARSRFRARTNAATVSPATPTISTTATPPAGLGGTSSDSATLTAPAGVTVPPAPAPTGTITFNLYGPNNTTCDPIGAIHSTSTVPVNHFGAPAYASAASNVIATPGTFAGPPATPVTPTTPPQGRRRAPTPRRPSSSPRPRSTSTRPRTP